LIRLRACPSVSSYGSVGFCTTLCDNKRVMNIQSSTRGARVEPWASVEEVTAHLGIVRDTAYRWIETKGMPAHRIGRLWKFKLSEVDAWVRSRSADEKDVGK